MYRTYAELNRNGEEVAASFFGNSFTSRNTRKIYIAWLHEAFLASNSLENLLGKSKKCVSSGTVYCRRGQIYRKPA
jgi:hypothetical protein